MHMAIEEHGAGKQMVRFRSWPRFTSMGVALSLIAAVLLALSLLAASDQAWLPAVVIGLAATLLTPRLFADCAAAAASASLALQAFGRGATVRPSDLQVLKRVETRGSGG
jgi:hypothetical protein